MGCIDVSISSNGGGVTPSPPPAPAPATTTTTSTSSQPASQCTAVLVDGESFSATDEKCDAVCALLPAGQWPCSASGPCNSVETPTTTTPTPKPTATPTAAPTASSGGSSMCGTCQGCLWTAHSACYKDWTKATCDRYDG